MTSESSERDLRMENTESERVLLPPTMREDTSTSDSRYVDASAPSSPGLRPVRARRTSAVQGGGQTRRASAIQTGRRGSAIQGRRASAIQKGGAALRRLSALQTTSTLMQTTATNPNSPLFTYDENITEGPRAAEVGPTPSTKPTVSQATRKVSMTNAVNRIGRRISMANGPSVNVTKRASNKPKKPRRPQLLCLHGWRSNASVTKMQIEHLGLDKEFDITYLEAPYQSDSPADESLGILSSGPYYSWVDDGVGSDSTTNAKDPYLNIYNTRVDDQLLRSLDFILNHIESRERKVRVDDEGNNRSSVLSIRPYYDAVYGFSQGASLAAILSCPYLLCELRQKFQMRRPPKTMIGRGNKESRDYDLEEGLTEIEAEWYKRPCWKFAYLGCAGKRSIFRRLCTLLFDISGEEYDNSFDYNQLYVKSNLASIHYIGIEDSLKAQSEGYIGKTFPRETALIMYLNGGHEIPAFSSNNRKDAVSLESFAWFIKYRHSSSINAAFDEDGVNNSQAKPDSWVLNSDVEEEEKEAWEDSGPLQKVHDAEISMGEVPFLSVYLQTMDFSRRRQKLMKYRRTSIEPNKQLEQPTIKARVSSMAYVPRRRSSDGYYSSIGKRRMSLAESDEIERKYEDVALIEAGQFAQFSLNRIMPTNSNLVNLLNKPKSDAPAIWSPKVNQPISYGDLTTFIKGEGSLGRLGVLPNDLVAYISPGGVLSATMFLSVAAQTTAAPLDPEYTQNDIIKALEQLKPNLLIVFKECTCYEMALAAADSTGVNRIAASSASPFNGLYNFDVDTLRVNNKSRPTKAPHRKLVASPDGIALILRTSGSTSLPKVVPIKMNAIVSNSRVIARSLGLKPSDVALNAMPLFHIGGLSSNLLSSLAAGASVIILDSFDVASFIDLLCKTSNKVHLPQPTWYSAVPTMHAALCECVEMETDFKSKHSLRFIRSGAAALPLDLAQRMEKAFGCHVVPTYSMTEQMPISQPPTDMSLVTQKPNSVGRACATSMCIVDQNLRPISFGEDKSGEICISGDSILDNYIDNPGANMKSFFEMGGMRWFRTGDMGYLDDEAFLFLTGRQKELIKRGGEQISPDEVEDACLLHPRVKTCIVFSIPDKLWGQRVGAAIILQEPNDSDDCDTPGASPRSTILNSKRFFRASAKITERASRAFSSILSTSTSNKHRASRNVSMLSNNSIPSREGSISAVSFSNVGEINEESIKGNAAKAVEMLKSRKDILAMDSSIQSGKSGRVSEKTGADLSTTISLNESSHSCLSHRVKSIRKSLNASLKGLLHLPGEATEELSEESLRKELKVFLTEEHGLQHFKVPEKIVFVEEWELPKTRSKKYIRTGLAEKLGVEPIEGLNEGELKDLKVVRVHESLTGVRFCLAVAVMYGHVGDFGLWNHARNFCLHVPAFFFIGGFMLAASTHSPVIGDLTNFYSLRLAVLHPMYLLSVILLTINFVIRCNPSNYIQDFQLGRQPEDGLNFVCQSTMAEMGWYPTLLTSLLSHVFAIQTWSFAIPVTWFLSNYGWFSSVYVFCVLVFPWIHRSFHMRRRDPKALWNAIVLWVVALYSVVGIFNIFWPLYRSDEAAAEFFGLCAYLFPPGWLPCFAIGVGGYFHFQYHTPNEKHSAWKWGVLTDILSVWMLLILFWFGLDKDGTTPDNTTSSAFKLRFFAFFASRAISPLCFVWLYGLAVGKGLTAKLLSSKLLVVWLAPASYNIYLFHQLTAEYYYLITRGSWWAYPKSFYWFSAIATPVSLPEFILLLVITTLLSVVLEFKVNSRLVQVSAYFIQKFTGGEMVGISTKSSPIDVVMTVVENITGADVKPDSELLDCGLSSMTTLVLISKIRQQYKVLSLTARDIVRLRTVQDLANLIEDRLRETAIHGGFESAPDENKKLSSVTN